MAMKQRCTLFHTRDFPQKHKMKRNQVRDMEISMQMAGFCFTLHFSCRVGLDAVTSRPHRCYISSMSNTIMDFPTMLTFHHEYLRFA